MYYSIKKKKKENKMTKNLVRLKNATDGGRRYGTCYGHPVVMMPERAVRSTTPEAVMLWTPPTPRRVHRGARPPFAANKQAIVFAEPYDDDQDGDNGGGGGDGLVANRGRPRGSKNRSSFNSFNYLCEKRSFAYTLHSNATAEVTCASCGRTYNGDPLSHCLEFHETDCPLCGRPCKTTPAAHIKSHGGGARSAAGQTLTVTCYECYECREKFGNAAIMAEHVLDEHLLAVPVVPATDEHAAATGEHAPATDEHAPATDEHAPATDEHAPATDEHAAATGEHAPATDEHSAATGEHAAATTGEHGATTGEHASAMDEHAAATGNTVSGLGCVPCGARFADRAALAGHLADAHCPRKTFSHPAVYRCRVCGAGFKSQINVLRHACNGIRTPRCERCDRTFPSKMRYAFHLQFHGHPRMHLHCDLCLAEFADEYRLYDHIRFRHELHDKAVCEICGRTFKSSMGLNIHRRYHTGSRDYACKSCGKSFLNKSTLKEHEISHMDVKPFQCHICGQYLSRASRLRSHVKTHRAAESTEQTCYCCGACGFAAPGPALLTRHAEKEHGGAQRDSGGDMVVRLSSVVKCEYCDSTYVDAVHLDQHRTAAHGRADAEAFVCVVCSSAFSTYSRLTTHKLTHGINVASALLQDDKTGHRFDIPQYFSCQHCAKMCLHYTYFCLHRRLKHAPDVQTYQCDRCAMQFNTSWRLTYHKKTAHGLQQPRRRRRPRVDNGNVNDGDDDGIANYKYQCTVCSRRFVKLGALNLHKTRTHIDAVGDAHKHLCHRCGKLFASEQSLDDHRAADASRSCDGRRDADGAAARPQQRRTCSTAVQPRKTRPRGVVPAFVPASVRVTARSAIATLAPYACELCDTSFQQDAARLRAHLEDHASAGEVFLCRSCFAPYLSLAAFQAHIAAGCNLVRTADKGGGPVVQFVNQPLKDEFCGTVAAPPPQPLIVDCSRIYGTVEPKKEEVEPPPPDVPVTAVVAESSLIDELFSIISSPRTTAVFDDIDSLPPSDVEEIFNRIAVD